MTVRESKKKKKTAWGLLEMKTGDCEQDTDTDAASRLLAAPAAVLSLLPPKLKRY